MQRPVDERSGPGLVLLIALVEVDGMAPTLQPPTRFAAGIPRWTIPETCPSGEDMLLIV